MPVAIMAGRGDKIVEIEPHPMRLHGLVRQSRLEVVDGTGHMVHHAFPDKVAAAVEALCADRGACSLRTRLAHNFTEDRRSLLQISVNRLASHSLVATVDCATRDASSMRIR